MIVTSLYTFLLRAQQATDLYMFGLVLLVFIALLYTGQRLFSLIKQMREIENEARIAEPIDEDQDAELSSN